MWDEFRKFKIKPAIFSDCGKQRKIGSVFFFLYGWILNETHDAGLIISSLSYQMNDLSFQIRQSPYGETSCDWTTNRYLATVMWFFLITTWNIQIVSVWTIGSWLIHNVLIMRKSWVRKKASPNDNGIKPVAHANFRRYFNVLNFVSFSLYLKVKK